MDGVRRLGARLWTEQTAFVVAIGVLLVATVGLFEYAGRTPDVPAPVVETRFLTPPAELPTTGSYIESRVQADGTVQVRQWIRTSGTLSRISLSAPDPDSRAGGPGASKVVVAGDGLVVSRRATVDTVDRSFYFSSPAQLVYLSYELSGAVQRSSSAAGRALAQLTALKVDYRSEQAPTVVRVIAPDVLSLACTPTTNAGTGSPRPCGEPGQGSWQVVLEGADRNDSVSAQVNLGALVRAGDEAEPARTR